MTASTNHTHLLSSLVVAVAIMAGAPIPAHSQITFTNYTTAGGLGSINTLGVYASGRTNYAATAGVLSVAAVPEPAACLTALAGLACGGYLMKRRRKRA